MVNSYSIAEHHQQRMDDLTQIRGIGPSMEHRLNQVGIFTFAQLANMSAEELAAVFAHMPGWSAERIAEMGLINQARDLNLIEKEATAGNTTPEDKPQYSAQFSIDLLLDTERRVRRTHIIHVQTRKEDSWAEWNEERLASFILQHAKIGSDRGSTEAANMKPAVIHARNVQQAQTKEIMGDMSISDVEIRARSGESVHSLVTMDAPFAITLTLDLSKTSISSGTPLHSLTEIYAKDLSDGKRYKIGEKQAAIESRDLVPLIVDCHALPQGSYRLEACILLSAGVEDSDPKSRLVAMTEGTVFRVS